jgi:hypothetical protein
VTQQGKTPPRKRKQKTIEDIKPVFLMQKGKRVEMYSITDAALYMGYSPVGFWKFLGRHPEIKKHSRGYDETKERYIKKEDLDRMMEAHVVEDDDGEPSEE